MTVRGPVSRKKSALVICPTCGKPVAGDDTFRSSYDGPLCSPLGSPDCWRVVGKATGRGVDGHRRMLTALDGGVASPSTKETPSA